MNLAPTYVGLALGWLVVVYLVIFLIFLAMTQTYKRRFFYQKIFGFQGENSTKDGSVPIVWNNIGVCVCLCCCGVFFFICLFFWVWGVVKLVSILEPCHC